MEQASGDMPGQPVNDKGQQEGQANKDKLKGQSEDERQNMGGWPYHFIKGTHQRDT
jgi:hypothetical protein